MAGSSSASHTPRGHAHWTLFLLFLVNVFNVGDRALLGFVAEPVRVELSLTDTELAILIGPLFAVFNLAAGLVIARMVDHGSRVRILALGLACWSAATAATGLAESFSSLAAMRIAVGIGEATAFPAAMSLIPDLFAQRSRGRAIAVFQTSGFVGAALSTVAAGMLAAAFGWRAMFVLCGAAGIVLAAVLTFSLREPARQEAQHTGGNPPFPSHRLAGLQGNAARVLRQPGFVWLASAFGLAAVVAAVLGAWGPAFLQRFHDVPLQTLGFVIGPAIGLGGIIGTLASGHLSDRLLNRAQDSRVLLRVPLVAMPLAAPFMAGFAYAPGPLQAITCMAMTNVLMSCAVAPCLHFALSTCKHRDRGLVSAIMLASAGVIGGGLGPFFVGLLSDRLALGANGLRYAIAATSVTPLLAAACLLRASRAETVVLGAGVTPGRCRSARGDQGCCSIGVAHAGPLPTPFAPGIRVMGNAAPGPQAQREADMHHDHQADRLR